MENVINNQMFNPITLIVGLAIFFAFLLIIVFCWEKKKYILPNLIYSPAFNFD